MAATGLAAVLAPAPDCAAGLVGVASVETTSPGKTGPSGVSMGVTGPLTVVAVPDLG